jgi:hypothetical protein
MRATYCKALCTLKKGSAVILSGGPRYGHALLIGVSDRLYATTSPHGSWASRTPTVLRNDSRK